MTSSSVKQLVIIPKTQWDEIMESGYGERVKGLEKTVQIPINDEFPRNTNDGKPLEEEKRGEMAIPTLPPPPSPSLHAVPEGPVEVVGGGGEEKGGEENGERASNYLPSETSKIVGVWKPPGISQLGKGFPRKTWISL